MSAAIDKYRHDIIILPIFAFCFDYSIKTWHAYSYAGSKIHSKRIFVIWVSNNGLSCRSTLLSRIIVSPQLRIASFGVPHREVELQTEFNTFTATHLESNWHQHMDWTVAGTCIKSSRSVYAPQLEQPVRLQSFKYRGGDNAQWISKNNMVTTAVQ